jgi:hypothetical protein
MERFHPNDSKRIVDHLGLEAPSHQGAPTAAGVLCREPAGDPGIAPGTALPTVQAPAKGAAYVFLGKFALHYQEFQAPSGKGWGEPTPARES